MDSAPDARLPAPDVAAGHRRVRQTTISLALWLLPVWIFGLSELVRFAVANLLPGPLEANGLLKGRDFATFYLLGTLAREGAWTQLHDPEALRVALERVIPAAAGGIPAPVYGPHVALFFAPWATLSYLEARWLWLLLTAVLYLSSAAIVLRGATELKPYRGLAWMTIVFNPAFGILLSTGQLGGLALMCWALAAASWRSHRQLLVGLCLGFLCYKPPMLVGVVIVFVVMQNWRAFVGVSLSCAVQFLCTLPLVGLEPWLDYLRSLSSLPQYYYLTDTIPQHKHSLAGFFQILVGSNALSTTLALVGASLVLAPWWFRRLDKNPWWHLPLLISTTVLVSPHFYVYDLVVLVPALLGAASLIVHHRQSMRRRIILAAGYALLFAPYSFALARAARIQLSTMALLVFVVAMHLQASDGRRPEHGAVD
jgi:alpha-1,2-mannosyltransferase